MELKSASWRLGRVHEGLRGLVRQGADFVWPPEPPDIAGLRLIDAPQCARCGFPFEVALAGLAVECGPCTAKAPRFRRARSALAYDDASAPLLLAFKHGGRTQHLDMFARQMVRAGRDVLEAAGPEARLVPVPLHPSRLRRRRFNQAALLARRMARFTDRSVWDGLHRIRRTESQGRKSAKGRARNVRGAFAVRGEVPRHCILVDDVMTTGATLEACALALSRAGAETVDVITLARVVREREVETRRSRRPNKGATG